MANDVEIRGKITVDSGNAKKSTADLKKEFADAKEELKGLTKGSAEYKEAQERLSKATKDLDANVSKSGGSFSKLKETLGATVPGFQGASEGASGFGKTLWALVANPIVAVLVAIVGACTLIYKAFTSTNDGADKMDQIFAGLSATVDVLRDRILNVATAISKFFSGDFAGAMQEGKKAVSGIGQEIADEFKAAAQATKTLQDLEDSMRAISVGRAELSRDLAKAKEIMSDSEASVAQRRKAINDVRAKEGEQNAKELEQARKNYEAIKALNALSDTSDEDLDKEAAAKVALINLETQSAQNIRSLNKLDRALTKEIEAKADAEQKERTEKRKAAKIAADEALKKANQAVVDAIVANAKELQDIELGGLDLAKSIDAEKAAIAQKEIERAGFHANLIKSNYEAEKQLAQEDKAAKVQAIEAVSGALANASALMGESTAAGKAVAVASATISTYLSAQKAYESLIGTPFVGPVIAPIAAGLAVAGGLASVKKILSVKVPGGGGGSTPSMPAYSAPAPIGPRRSSTMLDDKSIQGIGNAAQGGTNRSFVLESDIKNNWERAERINRAARLS